MAETKNYQLNIFEDDQDTLTFKEFRQLLAGTLDTSNMQKIDSLFGEMRDSIQEIIGTEDTDGIIAHQIKEAIASFKKDNDQLISKDDDGLHIGGQGNEGAPIDFNDGTSISHLENGTFAVNGVETSQIRMGDYVAKFNSNNKHLQISYKTKPKGV